MHKVPKTTTITIRAIEEDKLRWIGPTVIEWGEPLVGTQPPHGGGAGPHAGPADATQAPAIEGPVGVLGSR